MNHGENKKGALEENTGGDIYSPPRRRVAHLPSTSDRRPSRTEDEREDARFEAPAVSTAKQPDRTGEGLGPLAEVWDKESER